MILSACAMGETGANGREDDRRPDFSGRDFFEMGILAQQTCIRERRFDRRGGFRRKRFVGMRQKVLLDLQHPDKKTPG